MIGTALRARPPSRTMVSRFAQAVDLGSGSRRRLGIRGACVWRRRVANTIVVDGALEAYSAAGTIVAC